MRTPNLGTAFYAPAEPPQDSNELRLYLREEMQKISAAIQALALGHIDMVNVAPAKPRNGDIRYADGTNWNPGAGKGVYVYKTSSWVLLG